MDDVFYVLLICLLLAEFFLQVVWKLKVLSFLFLYWLLSFLEVRVGKAIVDDIRLEFFVIFFPLHQSFLALLLLLWFLLVAEHDVVWLQIAVDVSDVVK